MDSHFSEFISFPSKLATFYVVLAELCWIVFFGLTWPLELVWPAMIISVLLGTILLVNYWLSIWPRKGPLALRYSGKSWYVLFGNKGTKQNLNKTCDVNCVVPIRVLQSSMIFPHLVVVQYRCERRSQQQLLFWLDTLGKHKFCELSRVLKMTLMTPKQDTIEI